MPLTAELLSYIMVKSLDQLTGATTQPSTASYGTNGLQPPQTPTAQPMKEGGTREGPGRGLGAVVMVFAVAHPWEVSTASEPSLLSHDISHDVTQTIIAPRLFPG